MGRSPPKELLKEAVLYLEAKVDDVEQKAESYIEPKVQEVKKDTYKKASDILKDQKVQWAKTAENYEEKARDNCEAEVAQSRAAVIGEAWDAIQAFDQWNAGLWETTRSRQASHMGWLQCKTYPFWS